jgi:hypothetical protein
MRDRVKSLLGEDENETHQDTPLGDWSHVRHGGVGIEWLAGAFGMDRRKVKQRIAGVKPIGKHKTATGYRPVWSLREVAGYLAPRPRDLEAALRNMNSTDLPSKLQKDVWDARLKELAWREKAGDLWRTEDVALVFGEVFLTIKGQVSLWVDQLDEVSSLSEENRARLTQLTDSLQREIHQKLIEMPKKRQTRSAVAHEEDSEDDSDDGV